MPTKKRKPDVCTRYAVRGGRRYFGYTPNPQFVSFDRAFLFAERGFAETVATGTSAVVVPVRCRTLSAATKRSKKRTK